MSVTVRSFGVQAQEAIDVLRGKISETSLAWDSLMGPVHSKVFTVAGSARVDMVKEIHQSLVDASERGTTLSDFRKSFDATVQRHGWTYNGSRGWRTKVIFDTNMRSAHMAGRWQQLWANRDDRPYLQYRTAGDARVRVQHRTWNGAIYPITAAWWDTHYPPNGWGCRCSVRSYSTGDIAARRLTVQDPPEITYRDVVNRDGEITDRVPIGIDAGWDHNVGKSWAQPAVELGRKLMSLPEFLRGPMIAKTISPAFQQAIKADWMAFQTAVAGGQQTGTQVVGYADAETVDALRQLGQDVPVISSNAIGVTAATAERMATAPGWTAGHVADVPLMLRDYRAMVWDTRDSFLHVIPTDGPESKGQVGSVRLAINPPGRRPLDGALTIDGLAINSIKSMHSDRYKVMLGRLPSVTRKPMTLSDFTAALDRSGMTLDGTTAKALHEASAGMLDPEAMAKAITGADGKGLSISTMGNMAQSVTIQGDGVTIWGAKGCNVRRTFGFVDQTARHGELVIPANAQAAGVAKSMMQAALQEYERMGIARIELYANLDAGGYAWARYGFKPIGEINANAADVLARLAKATDLPDPAAAELAALQLVYNDHQQGGAWVNMVATAKTPALDAYLRTDGSYGDPAMPGGLTAGKALLINSGWRGELLMSDDAALERLRSYIDATR